MVQAIPSDNKKTIDRRDSLVDISKIMEIRDGMSSNIDEPASPV